MNYAVHYAPVSDSVCFAWENNEEPVKLLIENPQKDEDEDKKGKKFSFSLGSKKLEGKKVERNDFLESLTPDDIVWMELGGAGDRFARACAVKKAKMYRVPTIFVSNKEEREKRRKEQEEARDSKDKTAKAEPLAVEIARRIYRLAFEKPEDFYPYRTIDHKINDVSNIARFYLAFQRKLRVAHTLRSKALYRDLELIGGEWENPDISRFEKLLMADKDVIEKLKEEEKLLKSELENLLK